MMSAERIEQFRKMAQANPDDDLAHFALGQALFDAERYDETINVLRHVLKINQTYSRAYVLMGIAQVKIDDEDSAIETFQRGYAAAMNRGDLMPATEMKQRLTDMGAAIDPDAFIEFEAQTPDPDEGREPEEDEVRCGRSRRIGKRMTFDPFGDEIGAYITANISQESWEDWIEMSIKVINELRLDLGDVHGQRTYDEHMRDFLNLPAHLFEGRYED
ncbi:MAG: Fe(2+)-trafficking protein [Myxococcota bacterium]|nr:Fe(2+)-trafficking protein [Myxococcota bacterium]